MVLRLREIHMPAAQTVALPAQAEVRAPQVVSAQPTLVAPLPEEVAVAEVPLFLPGPVRREAPSRKSHA